MPKPIPFDSLVLMKTVEDAQAAVGKFVKKLSQRDANSLLIHCGGGGARTALLISVLPRLPRFHVCADLAQSRELCGFGRALKERCDNGLIVRIEQKSFDRIVEIAIRTRTDEYLLVAELFGPNANAYLLDSQNRIAARMRRAGNKAVGQIYASVESAVSDFESAVRSGVGLSAFLKQEVALRGAEEVIGLAASGPPVFSPTLGAYPFFPKQFEGEFFRIADTTSEAVEAFADAAVRFDQTDQIRSALVSRLERTYEAKLYALNQMIAALDAGKRAAEFQMKGELVLAHLHEAEGASKLHVSGYDGGEIEIALDVNKSPVENAEAYFRKSKKSRHGAAEVRSLIPSRKKELEEMRSLIDALVGAEAEALARLRGLAESRGWLHFGARQSDEKQRQFEGKKIRIARDAMGYAILWGENAEANDFVSRKIAKPNDLWLHIRANTGAHVIIQTGGRPERVQTQTLLAAAKIAVANSAQKHSKNVPVDYTLAKYVRKPKGSPPGTATYTHEKTVYVDGI